MVFIVQAVAAHASMTRHLGTHRAWHYLAGGVLAGLSLAAVAAAIVGVFL